MTGEQAAERAIVYMEKHIGAEDLAAIVIEPVQGEGGFITPAPGFLTAITKWAKANGVLIVADEVQAGIARTGQWFASEFEAGFEPDLFTIAKGIAGGMVISAVTGRADIMDAAHPGGIGGTFGGNPVSAAAAVSVLKQIEAGGVLEAAQRIEATLMPRLLELKAKYPVVGDVRGRGAMIAIEFVEAGTKKPNKEITDKLISHCHQNGVLVLNAGIHYNTLRFLPPLVITDELLNDAIDVLEAGIKAHS
jgi:4-aminobutyrate aminotransferase/(S)-3-amino-2-methylpropionate transaminase